MEGYCKYLRVQASSTFRWRVGAEAHRLTVPHPWHMQQASPMNVKLQVFPDVHYHVSLLLLCAMTSPSLRAKGQIIVIVMGPFSLIRSDRCRVMALAALRPMMQHERDQLIRSTT